MVFASSVLGFQQVTTVGEVVARVWPVAAISVGVSLIATPLCRRVALAYQVVDRPDDFLKPHKKPIPYMGGVAICLGWLAGLAYAIIMHRTGHWPEYPLRSQIMTGVAVAGLATMLIGLFDDLRVMSAKVKLATNIAVTVFLLWLGLGDTLIGVVTHVMQIEVSRTLQLIYSVPLVLLIVVGACNATNLIDGLDGLCGGVLGIISLGFVILAVHLRLYNDHAALSNERLVLALAMLGGAIGFLPFNINPAKIFMGDAGSMLLGLNAAIIILLFAEEQMLRWMLGAVMVFGLPVSDMFLTLARRWRNGRPLMAGDRSHFYDQLIDRGLSVRQVVAISYGLSLAFMLMGVSAIFLKIRYIILLYSAFMGLIAAIVWKLNMAGIEPDRRKPASAHVLPPQGGGQ